MKILVISQYYKPESFRVTDICEALAERGSCAAAATAKSPQKRRYNPCKIKFH